MNIKRFLSGALCAVLLLALCPAAAADAPCEISSAEELSLLRETPDGDFVLTADIDMTGVKGFKPIASKKEQGFTGTFDGQFHSIKGLRISRSPRSAQTAPRRWTGTTKPTTPRSRAFSPCSAALRSAIFRCAA